MSGTLPKATIFGAALVGCVLLVDPPDGTLRCAFDGANTVCGDCVARACQPQVNACCGVSSCDVSTVGPCAKDLQCAALLAGGATEESHALAACVSSACAAACTPPSVDGGSDTKDAATPDAGDARADVDGGLKCELTGGSCACSTDEIVDNTTHCSPAALGTAAESVICCAQEAYPAPGTSCECDRVGCAMTEPGSCLCTSLGGLQNTMPACPQEEWTCCTSPSGILCACSSRACTGNDVPSAGCVVADMPCPSGQRKVTACR